MKRHTELKHKYKLIEKLYHYKVYPPYKMEAKELYDVPYRALKDYCYLRMDVHYSTEKNSGSITHP